MKGTVTRVRKMGVTAQMDSPGIPTGTFKVVRKSDNSILGTVVFRKMKGPDANLNWEPKLDPLPDVNVGDFVQPV